MRGRGGRRGRRGCRGRGGRGRRGRGGPMQVPKRTRDSKPKTASTAGAQTDASYASVSSRPRPTMTNPEQRGPPGGRGPPETNHPSKRAHYLDVDESQQQTTQDSEERAPREQQQSCEEWSDEDYIIYTNDDTDPDAASPWNARTHYRQRSNTEMASSTATGLNQYVSPIARAVPLSPPPRWTEDGPDPRGFRGNTTTYGTIYMRAHNIPAATMSGPPTRVRSQPPVQPPVQPRARPPRMHIPRTMRALVAAHARTHMMMGTLVRETDAERFGFIMMMWLTAAAARRVE